MKVQRRQVMSVLAVLGGFALLVCATPKTAKACVKSNPCPVLFYPYNTEVDPSIYCKGSLLDNLGNQNWLFHCCSGTEVESADLYIHMPDSSTPSADVEWSAGSLD